jgi:hypothetical protein
MSPVTNLWSRQINGLRVAEVRCSTVSDLCARDLGRLGVGGEYGEGVLRVQGHTVDYYSVASASVGKPILGFVFSEKGLIGDLLLEGTKVTKIKTSD